MLKQRVEKSRQITVVIKQAVMAFLVGAAFLASADTLSAQRPNVLFISVDDLNDFTGYAGHPDAITPNMDRLASEGVYFRRAHCTYPLCGASRASVFSGLYFSELNTLLTQPDDEEVEQRVEAMGSSLLHTYFGDRGYKTMAVGKLMHRHVPDGSVDLSGGRSSFDSNENAAGQRVRSKWPLDLNHDTADNLTDWAVYVGENGQGTEADMTDTRYANWAIDRLEENHNDPFMLMVGFQHPHVPWYAPQRYFNMYNRNNLTLPPYLATDFNDIPNFVDDAIVNPEQPSTEWAIASNEWRNIMQAYLANVSYVDFHIGRVLDALEDSPYADNTIVILWGDHGYHLGEKNAFHKNTLWERSSVTPLIIKAPGMDNGRCDRVVSLIDLYPTLIDLCDLPANDILRGRSLAPLLQNPNRSWDFPAFTFRQNNKAVQFGDLRLITYEDGSQELYDHQNDPNEWTNRVNSSSYADELSLLESMSPFSDDFAPGSTVFTFVNGGPLDRAGVGGNMTVNGVTITTRDVIGLGGSRASNGSGDITNVGNTGGLGINSGVSDAAILFEATEGWEFTFNTDVQLLNIELLQTNSGGRLTISGSFPDIVIAGNADGDNDLRNTLVPANSVVRINYSHTGPVGTDGPRILSLVVGDPAPADASVFNFVNGGPLDRAGVGGNMTVGGVTITTQDVFGLEGTRASAGTNNQTNIGNTGGLGINSAASDTARNFESDEGWVFTFDTDVQLQNMDLLLTNSGGRLTISGSFPDVVIAGNADGDNDLGNTFVPANTPVSIFYSHTGPLGTDGPRIISMSVAPATGGGGNNGPGGIVFTLTEASDGGIDIVGTGSGVIPRATDPNGGSYSNGPTGEDDWDYTNFNSDFLRDTVPTSNRRANSNSGSIRNLTTGITYDLEDLNLDRDGNSRDDIDIDTRNNAIFREGDAWEFSYTGRFNPARLEFDDLIVGTHEIEANLNSTNGAGFSEEIFGDVTIRVID